MKIFDRKLSQDLPCTTFLRKVSAGFTLVELLIVVAIMGILASLIIANVTRAKVKAEDGKRISDLNQLKTAMQLYHNEYGVWPPGVVRFSACPNTACLPGMVFTNQDETQIYMREVPDYDFYYNPITPIYYEYVACVLLEDASNPAILDQKKCNGGSNVMANAYCVCND